MNYSASQQVLISKMPFGQIITKTPLNRTNRGYDKQTDQSMISQYQSPSLRSAMSPKAAREYLDNLKNFINSYDSKPKDTNRAPTQSIHEIYQQQTFIYFPLTNRLNDDIKLLTPNRIEVRKYNKDKTVHSLRYYYLKQPSLGTINDIPQSNIITIIGNKNSGKKQLFYELIKRTMPKYYKLQIINEQNEKTLNLQITDDIKSIVKNTLIKLQPYQLIAQIDQIQIQCRGIGGFKKDKQNKGILIMCLKPGKEERKNCVQTLKFLEQMENN